MSESRQPGLDKVLISDSSGAPLGTSGNPLITSTGSGPAATVNQGTGGSVASPWFVRPTADGATTSLPLPANAAQESGGHLASLDAKTPTIGQQTSAASTSITFASDIPTLSVSIPGNAFDRNVTGSISGSAAVTLSTQGCGVVALQLSGTWTGTVSFQASVDGSSWVSLPMDPTGVGSAPVTSATANGTWTGAIAGYQSFRAIGATVASGTATAYINASTASTTVTVEESALPAGAATAAKQPALGTAGSSSADVLSVQGVASGTALKVDPTPTGTWTLTSVASSASSGTILASNASRRGLTLFNNSTAQLYLYFSSSSATTTTACTVPVFANSLYEMPAPIYTGQINGIWASANGSAQVTEIT